MSKPKTPTRKRPAMKARKPQRKAAKRPAPVPTPQVAPTAATAARHTEQIFTRVTPATKAWLDALAATYGMPPADVLRRIVTDAQMDSWTPARSFARAEGTPTA